MPKILSAPPYFDDFDQSKNYQQILFKPSTAVQTRELNQLQTILQSQIERFGESIYKSGSVVTGGTTFVNQKSISVKLTDSYNGIINVTPLVGKFAKGRTTGVVGEVLMAIPKELTDPNTLIYVPRITGTNGGLFLADELIDIYNDQDCTVAYNVTVKTAAATVSNTTGQCQKFDDHIVVASADGITKGDRVISTLIGANTYVSHVDGLNVYVTNSLNFDIPAGTSFTFSNDAARPAILVSISEGVYFVDGYFLHVNPQTIVLDKYNNSPSYIVGLYHEYSIVTVDEDATLADNAAGSYNYAAPGADRLTIPLTLKKIPLVDDAPANLTDANFFELLRINMGAVLSQNSTPQYSEIEKTLSRRTYEESGDYLVRPFILNLKDDTKYDSALLAQISEGKAYVRGNEIEKISLTNVRVDRSRDTESVSDYEISSNYGEYVKISSITGSIPNIGTGQQVEIHSVTTGFNASTLLGTACLRGINYESGSSSGGVTSRAYLFNIQMADSHVFTDARSFVIPATAGVYTTILSQLNVATSGIISDQTQVYASDIPVMVFDVPQSFVKTITATDYTFRRVFKGVSFSSGVATITTANGTEQFLGGSGVISGSSAVANYNVVVVSGGASDSNNIPDGTEVLMDGAGRSVNIPVVGAGSPAQATLNLNASAFSGTADIVATIHVVGDSRRVKNLVQGFNKQFATPTATMSLAKSDVYRIVGIYDSGNPSVDATTASTDITSHYTFNNGQRDSHYDHGSISLKNGFTAPTGRVLVVFDYFTHTGGSGFLTVDSYSIGYDKIPAFTDSFGNVHELRDSIDFRPRRVDDVSTLQFQTFQIPHPDFGLYLDQSYYLSRIDKIVLSADGQIKVVKGISSFQNPQPPADLPDAMTMYTLVMPAYTQTAGDVKVIYENNRRYTMKDISAIDKRLGNVEYYTALNALEQSVANSTQTNLSGTALFKHGFLTDSMSDFTVADVGSPEFKASIDTVHNFARAPFKLNNSKLVWNASGSTSQKTGDLITAPYTEKAFITQNLATKFINVNPYNVLSNIGYLAISPSSDIWYDTKNLPVITVNNDNTAAFAVAQANAAAINQNASWGSWETNWTGVSDGTIKTSTRYKTTATVSSNTVTSADTVVVSKELMPYVRENTVSFKVTGLVPFSRMYAWLDGVNISKYVTPAQSDTVSGITSYTTIGGSGYTSAPVVTLTGGNGTGASAFAVLNSDGSITVKASAYGSGYTIAPSVSLSGGGGTGASATAIIGGATEGMFLFTDNNGVASGTIRIPNNSQDRFVSGSKRLILSNSTDSPVEASSFADAQYLSQGYINNSQTTITSTRTPVLIQSQESQTRNSYVDYRPAVEPTATRTFLDSTQTVTDVATKIAAATGTSLATATATLNAVISAYNTAGAATPIRTIGSQTGLPDLNGAEFWTLRSILSADPNPTQTVSDAINAARVAGTEGSQANRNANGTFGPCVLDPLAQTFFIDSLRNPQGVFISAIDLFFASKDASNPVIIEIRPTVNGYPSSSVVVPLSQFAITPDLITTSVDGTVATKCSFPSPVYLSAGEYAIVIKSNSNKYNLYVAELGKALIGQNKAVTEQPYVGSLFQSQNASTWTASQELDLCFNLYKCEFAIGTTKFYLNGVAPASEFDYDLVNITSQELTFGNATDISAKISTSPLSGSQTPYSSILLNTDTQIGTRQKLVAGTDLKLEYTMVTRSIDVSPVVDLERSSAILVQNVINQQSDWVIPETSASGGDAKAKYLSKKVVLGAGFDADNLVVYLDVNRPAGTSIQVYYRVLNAFDNTDILNRPWVQMNNEVNGGFTSSQSQTVEDKYSAYGISYTNNGATYNSFRTFQIKVVMLSNNASLSPYITDVRELALS